MNALIHSFDRIEAPAPSRRPGFLLVAWRRLAAALRESRERRALAQLSEWNEHMLRDIGLTRDDVRSPRPTVTDGRWLIDNTRLGER
jgi:uncharacterized protein YjiS (DUF1127 family)